MTSTIRRTRRPHARLAVAAGCALAAAVAITGYSLAGTAPDGGIATAAVGPLIEAPGQVPASADTYVVAEQPATRYGTATKVAASNWSTWHSEAYLRFDLPAPPAGTRIAQVRLGLTFQRLDQQAARLDVYRVTGAWSETTTYADRPSRGALVATATIPGQGTTGLSIDVSAAVPAAGTYSFALVNPSSQSAAVFDSRERGASGPRLAVTYEATTGGPLCGASFTSEQPGETYQQAFHRLDTLYGGLDTVRVFYGGLPANWPGKLDAGNRPLIVSFKAAPRDILAGAHDAYLRAWFRAAPTNREISWTYYHEPEDNIRDGEFTAPDYRAAWQRLARLADEAGNPRLRATLILMGWSLDPRSGRNWRDYYPGRDTIDVLGWDNYNDAAAKGRYASPAEVFGRLVEVSRAEGLPFGIAETGSAIIAGDDGTGRAAWLRDAVRYLTEAGALYIAYFDLDWREHSGVDYRLRDAPGAAAWREFCTRR